MKFGLRTPSLKKRFTARISIKRRIRAKIRMPRGAGFTNPKRALYNRVYNRTSISVDSLAKKALPKQTHSNSSSKGCVTCLVIITLPITWPFWILYHFYKLWRNKK